MIKLKTFDYIFIAVALIGLVASLFSPSPIYFGILFIALVALYLEFSIFGYLLIGLMIIDSTYFIDYIYTLFIGYYVYLYWIDNKKPFDRVIVTDLHKYHQQYYVNVLLIIIGLNLLMLVMTSGVLAIFSAITLLSILISTFKIFACWMIAKGIFEASYFYLAFLMAYVVRTFLLVGGYDIFILHEYLYALFISLFVLTIMYITKNITTNK